MASGTVKFYNGEKGYGFIAPEQGGDDIFVHATALPQGSSLKDGDKVSFEIGQDNRTGKSRAENVRIF